MRFDFDEIIDRRNTNSIKYDFAREFKKPEGILPLWVADMDFRTPPCVTEALIAKAKHGIFGYSEGKADYFEALSGWFAQMHKWEIHPEWLVKTPSVVYAICAAIRSLTKKGDAIIIQQPVYYPFEESVLINGRKLVVNELVYANGRYTIDFDDFENSIVKNNVRMFILCSPHNPVGRVWTREELTRMGDICLKHGVIVISDEIHQDFILPGHEHTVFSAIKPEYADITVTCTSPSKTFNLAGLQIANIFITNRGLRKLFIEEVDRTGYSQPNIMGLIACQAAYSGGREWLRQLMEYLTGNIAYVREFLRDRLPEIKLVEPEGTYLLWLDCKALGMTDAELDGFIVNKAGLWLNAGTIFGRGGSGFTRINVACPRPILQRSLEQLESAIRKS